MTIDPSAFHDFEQAGWERAAEHYAEAFVNYAGRNRSSTAIDQPGTAGSASAHSPRR